MFYFENYNGRKVLRSDYIEGADAFFTTRDGFDFDSVKCKRIVTPNQTHTSNVCVVDDKNDYLETDGLITDKNDCLIYLRFADCTPLVFYDSSKNACAVSHAGWRGTAGKIAVKTIEKMESEFGCNPKDITVLIGPAISLCCYEVGDDVMQKLLSTVNDNSGLFYENNVDLKKINARQLEEIGVEQIDICPYCTCCNNDMFYSYRKENGTPKRHFATIRGSKL